MVCVLCGSDAGVLNDQGAHNLCAARAARGVPTPSLGTKCQDCNGVGYVFPKGWTALNPTQATFEQHRCQACGGRGVK